MKFISFAYQTGNNGGDGLVAARHLKLFGYDPQVFYPKKGKSELFERLVTQLKSFEIEIIENLDNDLDHSLILDALFGFSKWIVLKVRYYVLLSKIRLNRL